MTKFSNIQTKEIIMTRKFIIMSWVLAALLGSAAAQESMTLTAKQKLARRGYLQSLKSEHACIRNSAIFQVMQYRARFPQDDMSLFIKSLRDLSRNDSTPKNRLYAFLACTFLENQQLLLTAGVPPKGEDEKEIYFNRLQRILHTNETLASN